MADRKQRGQQQCRDTTAQRHLPGRLDAPAHQASKITDGRNARQAWLRFPPTVTTPTAASAMDETMEARS